jgi:hypothetical protein
MLLALELMQLLLALELMQLLLGLVLQALVLLALVLTHLLLALLLEKLEKMQTHCHLKLYCPADIIQLSGLERKVHADSS